MIATLINAFAYAGMLLRRHPLGWYRFDLATSTDIFNHGDEWLQKMRRLKRLGYRPDRCLIAAREPKDGDGLKADAFREICEELKNDDFVLAGEFDAEKVIAFARLPESPDLSLAP